LGYAACAQEIMAQAFDEGVAFDRIVVASGSAGTHSGLIAGLVALNAGIPVTGINVRRPRAEQEAAARQMRLQDLGQVDEGVVENRRALCVRADEMQLLGEALQRT
jgi:1-aminocyclopropane-1-carboxylate deaminase/D-cysteine desulfhydrase-like pyridoxal-dependent ACC family enzyme